MTYNQKTSAAKSGMCAKTARKYTKSQKLPRDLKSSRDWSTRSDPFEKTWDSIEELLEESPTLEAKTILEGSYANRVGRWGLIASKLNFPVSKKAMVLKCFIL